MWAGPGVGVPRRCRSRVCDAPCPRAYVTCRRRSAGFDSPRCGLVGRSTWRRRACRGHARQSRSTSRLESVPGTRCEGGFVRCARRRRTRPNLGPWFGVEAVQREPAVFEYAPPCLDQGVRERDLRLSERTLQKSRLIDRGVEVLHAPSARSVGLSSSACRFLPASMSRAAEHPASKARPGTTTGCAERNCRSRRAGTHGFRRAGGSRSRRYARPRSASWHGSQRGALQDGCGSGGGATLVPEPADTRSMAKR